MAHEHGSGAGKCDCDCNGHSSKNYVFIPASQNYGPPFQITSGEINMGCLLVFWGIVAYGIYGCGVGALESVLLAPVVVVVAVAVLAAVVVGVIWLVLNVPYLRQRLTRSIRRDKASKVSYEYLYKGKKQKPKDEWEEASLILFLTSVMVLFILIDRFYF